MSKEIVLAIVKTIYEYGGRFIPNIGYSRPAFDDFRFYPRFLRGQSY